MAAETETLKFNIADAEYEIPALDDFDMDEWQIVYDYSGLVLEDFAPAADRAAENPKLAADLAVLEAELKFLNEHKNDAGAKDAIKEKEAEKSAEEKRLSEMDGPLEKARQHRISTPAFTTALLHIGYRRSHPDAKPDAIKKLVGSTKRLHVLEAMADAVPDGDAADPPAKTPALEPPSPQESGVSSGPESNDSPQSSDKPALHRVPTGTSA